MPRSFRHAYTLIEVLTAVAIVGVLVGLLVPAINSIRNSAQRAQCVNNMQLIALAALSHHEVKYRLPSAVEMSYATPAKAPQITDSSGIPPDEMLADLIPGINPLAPVNKITDSPTRKNSDPRYPFGPNWLVYLLPYLEQTKLYEKASPGRYLETAKETKLADFLDLGLFNTPKQIYRDTWRLVRGETIPVLRCPADVPASNSPWAGISGCEGPWARGNYAANAGPGWWQMSLNGKPYTVTNKDGNSVEELGWAAPVMGINFGANVKQIRDGASTTVMINEVRSGVTGNDPRGAWAMGLPGASVTASNAIGDCKVPNDRDEGSDDIDGCPKFFYAGIGTRDRMGCSTGFANFGWPCLQAQARSQHRGGVNAAFCDGSVRFVHDYVSQSVWFSMLSTNDGVSYSFE